jgi:tRNA pseudouridine38-40 synthase
LTVYRLDLAYDGAGFRGWARNAGVASVQETIEDALETILGGSVTLSVAGRTDAGVHARGQVASFSFDGALDAEATLRSLRGMLGPEISVRELTAADGEFDARFSASWRRYRYFIDESGFPDPLNRGWVWHLGEQLDIDAMNQAAAALIGPHDFASLCRAAEGRSTERTVDAAGWRRSGLLVYEVTAGAFCHQMVRSMVALCVDVGRGKVAAHAVPGILEARDRNAARGVAPPHGLVLWEVGY